MSLPPQNEQWFLEGHDLKTILQGKLAGTSDSISSSSLDQEKPMTGRKWTRNNTTSRQLRTNLQKWNPSFPTAVQFLISLWELKGASSSSGHYNHLKTDLENSVRVYSVHLQYPGGSKNKCRCLWVLVPQANDTWLQCQTMATSQLHESLQLKLHSGSFTWKKDVTNEFLNCR